MKPIRTLKIYKVETTVEGVLRRVRELFVKHPRRYVKGWQFDDGRGQWRDERDAVKCCALGAIAMFSMPAPRAVDGFTPGVAGAAVRELAEHCPATGTADETLFGAGTRVAQLNNSRGGRRKIIAAIDKALGEVS